MTKLTEEPRQCLLLNRQIVKRKHYYVPVRRTRFSLSIITPHRLFLVDECRTKQFETLSAAHASWTSAMVIILKKSRCTSIQNECTIKIDEEQYK